MHFLSKKVKLLILIIIISSANVFFIYPAIPSVLLDHIINDEALVIAKGLRLREHPNTTSRVLCSFKFGDRVRVKKISPTVDKVGTILNRWWKVETKEGLIGWVFAEYMGYPFLKNENEYIYVNWRLTGISGPILVILKNKQKIEYNLDFLITSNIITESNKLMWGKQKDYINPIGFMWQFIALEIKNLKIRDDIKSIVITGALAETLQGAGFLGGFYCDIWFKYSDKGIYKIFNNIRKTYYYFKANKCIMIQEKDQLGNTTKIKQIYNYIPIRFDFDDFEINILDKLSSDERAKITKYYLQNYPENKGILEENGLIGFSYYNLTKETHNLLKKYFDIGEISPWYKKINLTADAIKKIKKMFLEYNYKPEYILKKNLSNRELKEAREILKKIGYKWDDFTYHYKWNGERFELEEDIFPNYNIIK